MREDALTVRIHGLEVFGRHGVLPEETALGQRFVVDLEIVLADSSSTASDDLAATVDYAALADAVAAIVAGEPVALLERLAGLVADRALAEPLAREVTVTVRKPHVAIPQTVRETAVTLRRAAS
jgi:dihydroneopterin aldolase